MLNSVRTISETRIGKIVMALLMGLIIFGFGIFGISDVFNKFGTGRLASVGSTEISAVAFKNAYEREKMAASQQMRRNITDDEARKAGLDRLALNKLITDEVLNQKAKALSLGMSDESVAKIISEDPTFQDGGKLDKRKFELVIRNMGYNEAGYVAEEKKAALRREIGGIVYGESPAPAVLLDTYNAFANEQRSIDYITLPASSVGTITPPDDAALKTFFEARKAEFRAPEYRKIVMLSLSPASLAKPDAVSDADATALYERVKDKRFVTPETRSLQQIIFPTLDEAKAAQDKLKSGMSFAALAEQRKMKPSDIDLGVKKKDTISDAAVADAAFALPADGVSDPIKGPFGFILVHVAAINPQIVKSAADVLSTLKQEIAVERAKTDTQTLRDKIEDQRASGKALPEAAKSAGQEVMNIDGIDASGLDKTSKLAANIPELPALTKAVFASDIGVDNETILNRDGGYTWFEVQKIEPSHDRSLDEVKDRVLAAWTETETAKKLSETAADAVKKLNSGTSMNDIAVALGNQTIKSASNITRAGKTDLPANFVVQIFNQPTNGAASIGLADGSRAVFKVTGSKVPPLDPASKEATQIGAQLKVSLSNDIMSEYVTKLQSDAGVRINEQTYAQELGK